MSAWRFGDGSELRSGGLVLGDGAAARELRERIEERPPRPVQALPIPMRLTPLDVGSDYLLDILAREVAWALRQRVETEYAPDLADAPAELRERVEHYLRERDKATPGTVY